MASTQQPGSSLHMLEADTDWRQPVSHEPELRPSMSDQTRCFRQSLSLSVAALTARRDAEMQAGERKLR